MPNLPTQLNPNGWRVLIGLWVIFRLQGWPDINLRMIKYLYQLKNAPNSCRLYYLQAYPSETPWEEGDNSRRTVPILGRDTSDKQGKGEWFYVRIS